MKNSLAFGLWAHYSTVQYSTCMYCRKAARKAAQAAILQYLLYVRLFATYDITVKKKVSVSQ
jgi:hypothetical protein